MSPDLVHAFLVSERLEPVWRGVVEMPSRDVLAMMVAGSGRGVWHSPPPRCPQQRREWRASTSQEGARCLSFAKSPICWSMADGPIVGISGAYTPRGIIAMLRVGYVDHAGQ